MKGKRDICLEHRNFRGTKFMKQIQKIVNFNFITKLSILTRGVTSTFYT